jgi:hypothetical protein
MGHSLASLLIEGEGIELPASATLARAVSVAAGHIPYYIHCLVAHIAGSGIPVTETSVPQHLDSLICNPNDPAHFRYYRERLHVYYEPQEEAIALAALDALAAGDQPQSFDGLLNLVRHKISDVTSELVRDTLNLLSRDHYIHRQTGARGYDFRYPIVRRWWKFERG